MDKDIDKILFETMENVKVPQKIENQVKDTINELPKKNINLKKIKIVAIILIVFLIGNVGVIGVNYFLTRAESGTIDEGIDTAMRENYLQKVNMNYKKSNGIGTKVDYILMDDYKLHIQLSYEFSEDISDKNFVLGRMIITDENKNLIFCDDAEAYKEFCKKNKREYSEMGMRGIFTDGGYGYEIVEKSLNTVKVLYTLYSTIGYPKSKSLYIDMTKIDLSKEYVIVKAEDVETKKGKWRMKLALSEQFYNRENTKLVLQEESDNIKLEELLVTNMCTTIKFKTNKEVKTVRIRNEKGKEFGIASAGENAAIEFNKNHSEDEIFSTILTMTNYDITDKIYLVLIMHDGTEIIENLRIQKD